MEKIQWHPAFCAAMQLTLLDYHQDLEFISEYNLNKKPLELDLLILRKSESLRIRERIGHIFRGHNLFEYKSPKDELNIDVLYKALGYTCLYKAYGEAVDERKASDITLSLVRYTEPAKLLNRLRADGKLEVYAEGIYYVKDLLFPVQIIVAKELEPEERPYLSYLTGDLDRDQAKELVFRAEKETSHLGKQLIDSLLHVIVQSNNEVFEIGKKEDANMCEALRELMAPEIAEETAKARANGLAEGRATGLAEGLATGLAEGRATGLAEGRATGLAEGRATGLAEGRATGLAEGRAEGQLEAHKTLINNLSATLMEKDPSLTRDAAVEQAKVWLKMS